MERIGQQFGNYRLARLLGEGSFAQVYLGEHIYLERQVAIKVLRMQLVNTDLDQFLTEARTVAGLAHPNVVRVLDFGVSDETPYLILDYAARGTLRQRVPRGARLPLQRVATYLKQAAAALQYAHEQRFIHRDVKPENMLLGSNDELLLSDFGVALMAQSTRNQGLQDIAGTIPYIAPEAIQGRPLPASDQYSLAIVAYEWLSGKRPFEGSVTEVIAQHLSVMPIPLRSLVATLPPAAEMVVSRALAKDASQRFPTIRDFALALEQVALASPLPPVPPVPPLSSSRSFQQSVQPRSIPPTPLPPVASPVPSQMIYPPPALAPPGSLMRGNLPPIGTIIASYRSHTATVRTLSWSPDMLQIISAGDEKRIYVWDPRSGSTITSYLDLSNSVRVLAISPDGRSTATVGSDLLVRTWDRLSNTLLLTYRGHGNAQVNALAWLPAPGMQIIASGGDDGMVQVWEAGREFLYATYAGHAQKSRVNTLAWSPDAQRIVSAGSDGQVYIWDARTGAFLSVYPRPTEPIQAIAWSPDGKRVAAGRENGLIQRWEVATGKEDLTFKHTAPVNSIAWSPDGLRFAYADEAGDVLVWSTVTNLRLHTFSHGSPVHAMSWSPDGTLIASGGADRIVHVWVAG